MCNKLAISMWFRCLRSS